MNQTQSIWQRIRMTQNELEVYYRERRAYLYRNNIPIKGIFWRKKIHGMLILGLKISRIFSKKTLHIISDKRKMTNRPIIYACTHIGWDDVEMALAAIKRPCWIFAGDPREMYRNIEGLLMYINGVIFCDTDVKSDRHIGKETCIHLLQQGGDLLIFPEGAWNISENQLVMKLFTGTAEMAIRTKADIIPIGIEQYGKECYISIGENIDCSKMEITYKRELTEQLRDALATEKWNIWNLFSPIKRSDLSDDYSEAFLSKFEEQTKNQSYTYTLDDIYATKYRDKSITEPDDAFSYLPEKYRSLYREFERDKYCELVMDWKNPVYPTKVHKELEKILKC